MRIAIFTLGTRGDVQPYVALSKHAISKGHSAIICTGNSFKEFILEEGIEFQETASDLMAMLETEEGQKVFNHAMKQPFKTKKFVDDVVNPAFRKTLDQFWQGAQGADVIVFHPKAFGAPDIAKALGIPCIHLPPVPTAYPIEEFPNLVLSATGNFGKTINKWTYTIMKQAESASIKEVNDFREKTLHLPKRKTGLYTFEVDGERIPIIYPLSPALFEDVTSWQGHVELPGFFFLESEEKLDSELEAFIKVGPAPIIISFGSMALKDPEVFKKNLLAALEKSANRAVILTGNTGMTFESNDQIFATKGVPHLQLFPLGKGIIHHGGVGTMAAALRSGKPQLIIPFGVDQPFWAKRLFERGYSLQPIKEKDITIDGLVERMNDMEADRLKKRVEEISRMIKEENGLDKAVAYIEKVVEKSCNGA